MKLIPDAPCGRFSAAASALPSGSPRPVRVGGQRSGRGELKVVCYDFIQTVYFTTVTYTTAVIPFKAVALILQVPAFFQPDPHSGNKVHGKRTIR